MRVRVPPPAPNFFAMSKEMILNHILSLLENRELHARFNVRNLEYLSGEGVAVEYFYKNGEKEEKDSLLLTKDFIETLTEEQKENLFFIVNEIKEISEIKRKELFLTIYTKTKDLTLPSRYEIKVEENLDTILRSLYSRFSTEEKIHSIEVSIFELYEILNENNKKETLRKIDYFLDSYPNLRPKRIKITKILSLLYKKQNYYLISKEEIF